MDPDDDDYDDDAVDKAILASFKANYEKLRRKHWGPPIAVNIPQELYTKAQDHQDQLTQEERQLLLSRGDNIGKVLAQPNLVTDVERNDVLGRPHPDAVRASIQRVTGGQMSTVAELISKARADVQSLSKDELELMFNNFNERPSMWEKQFDDTPGAKEARTLLLPVEDRDVLMTVGQYRIMAPQTKWKAYLAAQKEESERYQTAKAKRIEEMNRVIGDQNARESRQQLYRERDGLGEDEFRRQLALTNLHLCVNPGSSTIVHPKNAPRYDPIREIFVSPLHEEVENQRSEAEATPLDEENRTIMQSNASVDDTNGQRELGASSHIEHFQQENRPEEMRRFSTRNSHRAHPYNTAARRLLTPVSAATRSATSPRDLWRQLYLSGESSARSSGSNADYINLMGPSQPSSLAISGSSASASSRWAPIKPPDDLDMFRMGPHPEGPNPPFSNYGTENWD
jgi:hypothetical protein